MKTTLASKFDCLYCPPPLPQSPYSGSNGQNGALASFGKSDLLCPVLKKILRTLMAHGDDFNLYLLDEIQQHFSTQTKCM